MLKINDRNIIRERKPAEWLSRYQIQSLISFDALTHEQADTFYEPFKHVVATGQYDRKRFNKWNCKQTYYAKTKCIKSIAIVKYISHEFLVKPMVADPSTAKKCQIIDCGYCKHEINTFNVDLSRAMRITAQTIRETFGQFVEDDTLIEATQIAIREFQQTMQERERQVIEEQRAIQQINGAPSVYIPNLVGIRVTDGTDVARTPNSGIIVSSVTPGTVYNSQIYRNPIGGGTINPNTT